MAEMHIAMTADNADIVRKLRETSAGIQNFQRQAEASGTSIDEVFDRMQSSIRKIGTASASMFTINKVKDFIAQCVDVRKEIQSLEISFNTLLDSETKGAKMIGEIREFAATTPMDVSTLAQAAQTMLGFNIEAEKVMPMLRAIGDVSMGDAAKFSSLALAFSQMSSTGKLMGQDLLQMINAGFNPLVQISEKTGKSIAELKDEMSAGKISVETVTQAFMDATSEGGKFNGMLAKQSEGLAGSLAYLRGTVSDTMNEIGEGLEDVTVSSVNMAASLVKNYKNIGETLAWVAGTYGTYKAAVMIESAMVKANTSATNLLSVAKTKLAACTQRLYTTLAAHPYALVAAAVVAAGYGIYKLATAETAAEKAAKAANDELDRQKTKLEERRQGIDSLISTITSKDTTDLQKTLAFEELKKIAPEITNIYTSWKELANVDMGNFTKQLNTIEEKTNYENLLKQQKALQDIIKAYNEYTDARSGKSGAVDTSILTDLNSRLERAVSSYNKFMGTDFSGKFGSHQFTKDFKTLSNILQGIDSQIVQIYHAKQKLAQSPEIKLNIAQGNLERAQEKLDYIERVMGAFKQETGKATISLAMTGEGQIDSVISDIDASIAALQEEAKSPLTFTAEKQQALNELQSLKTNILDWKQQAVESGWNNLPFHIIPIVETQMEQFRTDAEVAKNAVAAATTTSDAKDVTRNKNYWKTQKDNAQTELDALSDIEANGKKGAELRQKIASYDAKLGLYSSTSSSKSNNEAKRLANEAARRAEEIKAYYKNVGKAVEEGELEIAELQISQMNEGLQKSLRQAQLAYRRREHELKASQESMLDALADVRLNEWLNTNPKATDAKQREKKAEIRASLTIDDLSPEQKSQLKSLAELYASEFQKSTEKALETERSAMNDYLAEYGTYQQRKLAIASEYAEKIKHASSEGERLSLAKERDTKVASINANELANNIDWSVAFSGVGNVLGSIAKETLQKVDQYISTSEFKQLPAESKKAYMELRQKLQEQSGGNSTSAFNFGIWGKVADDVKRYQDSVRKAQKANEDCEIATVNLQKAQEKYDNALTEEDKRKAKIDLQIARTTFNTVNTHKTDADSDVDNAYMELTDSTTRATNGLNNFAANLSEISNGSLYGFANGMVKLVNSLTKGSSEAGDALSSLGGKVGGIIGAILQVLDAMGDNPTDFIHGLLDNIFTAVNGIVHDLLSNVANPLSIFKGDGLIGSIASSVVDFAGGFWDTLTGGMFGTRVSDKDYNRDMERLSQTNEALEKAISRLTNVMNDTAVANLSQEYEKQRKLLDEMESHTREQMQRTVNAYKDSNIFGNGGHDSARSIINRTLSKGEWSEISQIVGKTVRNAEGFFALSTDEMSKVANELPGIWMNIMELVGKGYKNGTQYIEEYIEYAEKANELEKAFQERLTDTTFDTVEENFKSKLLDMTSDTKDFIADFEKMLQQAIINSMISDTYSKRLKEWYNSFSEAMKDGSLTTGEGDSLRSEWDSIVNDALNERNALKQMFGWSDTASNQQASQGYSTQLSEDTGTEISGRLSALYELAYLRNGLMQDVKNNVIEIKSLIGDYNTFLNNLEDLGGNIILYLRDIAKDTVHLKQILEYIKKIENNTKDS